MIPIFNFDYSKYYETQDIVSIIVHVKNKILPLTKNFTSFTKLKSVDVVVAKNMDGGFTFRDISENLVGINPVVEFVFYSHLDAEKTRIKIIKAQYIDFLNYIEKEFDPYPEYTI